MRHWVTGLAFLTALGSWATAVAGESPAVIEYCLKKPGRVSLAVYDDQDRLVRTLLRGEKQSAGEHRIAWDGLNRNGHPASPGSYTWKLLRTPGFRAEYVTSLGINPDSAPYHRWVGNHGGAASVAVDESGMYAAAQVTETAPVLLKQSLDGSERLWTRDRGDVTKGRYQGGASLASDGQGTLYMLQQNGYLQVIDAEKGRRRETWDVLPPEKKRKSEGGETFFIYQHKEKIAGADMDARGETIVVSYRQRNEVRWLNPDDGSKAATIKVPSPTGVAVGSEEEVFVISENRVLAVSPDGTRRTLIDSGLTAPRRLAVDPASNHLLVAERGASHQVKRFSMEGELLETYGRRGGRREGTYHAKDFRGITDITADGRGGFLVAELRPAPRRVAHLDSQGEILDEWYGGQPYYAWGEPDPRDPAKVWFNPGAWLALAEVNYETGTWQLLETYHLDAMADGLVSSFPGHRGRWQVLYHKGQRYLVSQGIPQVLAHEEGTLTPVSVVGTKQQVKRAAEIAGTGSNARAFRWVDDNSDGRPQEEEFTFTRNRNVPRSAWLNSNFALLAAGNAEEDGQTLFTILRTKPKWSDGKPVYPIGEEPGLNERVAATPSPTRTGSRGRGAYRDAEGNFYGHFNAGPERHGTSWPTYWGGVTRFVRFDADGNFRWSVGRHAIHGGLGDAPGSTPPGYLHVPVNVIGEAHDTVILADRVERPAMAWTKDGLYAGSFFQQRTKDGLPENVYHWWRAPDGTEAITTSDNAQGGRVIQREDGTVLWFVQGRNSVPIYKVHGWKGWSRRQGNITLSQQPPHAKREGTGLTAEYYTGPNLSATSSARRVDEQVWHGVPRGEKGNQAVIDAFRDGPAYDWSAGVDPLQTETDFAVRWSGEIEAPLSEPFTFSVYARGAVRLWIDGKQRIFGWNQTRNRWESEPISLQAGRRYAVQLDFSTSIDPPACSLNWESPSLDRRRIPTDYLYPTDVEMADQPDVRPATQQIDARTFDAQSGQIGSSDVRDAVRGLRQRALGVTGAYLGYHRLDFGKGVSRLKVKARGRPAGDADFKVTFEFRIGSPDGRTIATLAMNADRGDNKSAIQTTDVARLNGIHDIYVVNTTPKRWHFVRLYWFAFE